MRALFTQHKVLISFALGIILAATAALAYQVYSANTVNVAEKLVACEQFTNDTQKLDCWYEVMRVVHNKKGTAAAFEVFNTLYENEPMFVNTGCHLHAHRIGDYTYYDNYVLNGDLDAIEFPDGSQVCGYGFYHGFFEHLIQDKPDPGYVAELCEYFDNRLGERMPGMRITCYHGSGHGFALAEVDEGDLSHWGNYTSIIEDPLRLCEQLTEADEGEREECRQGVFNVLVLWMESGEYGLTYDWEDPFWICRDQAEINKHSCYYEVGQKMDRVSDRDLDRAIEVIDAIPDEEFKGMLLHTAVAGFLQSTLTEDAQYQYMEQCVELEEGLQSDCIAGIVGGVIEHGDPGDEHVKSVELCSLEYLNDTQRAVCFDNIGWRLRKFYPDEQIAQICRKSDSMHFKEACIQSYGLEI